MTFRIYRRQDRETLASHWHWYLQSPNGQKVAREAQFNGYADVRGCLRGIALVQATMRKPAPIFIRRGKQWERYVKDRGERPPRKGDTKP